MDHIQKYILFVCIVSISYAQCPDGPNCSKCQFISGAYEIYCAFSATSDGFTVVFKPHEFVKITCHNSSKWSDFHLGTVNQIEGVKSISFKSCPLPRRMHTIVHQLIDNDIEELDFRSVNSNTVLNLNKNCFDELRSIERLTFSSNTLINLPSDLLSDLENLKVLNLRMNHLETLPDNFFLSPNLEAIELGINKLKIIKRNTFRNLKLLKLLNVWNNMLDEIEPEAFDELSSLMSIDIHSNNLQNLPDHIFTYLPNLRVINLSQNNFSTLSLSQNLLMNNTNLETFKFSENKQNLETLPSLLFANLTKLTSITMNRNGLIYLPDNLFLGATSLKNLELQKNSFTTLPMEIFKDCKKLNKIIISFNNISYLPDGIFKNLSRLEELNLSNNRITSVSEFLFADLSFLKILNMERNDLKTIHANSLISTQNLRIAKFSHNQLSLKDVVAYQDEYGLRSPFQYAMERIEELHLSYNNIPEIFADWIFATRLRYLNLSHNNITTVVDQDFQFISNDLSVDLTYNEIHHISLSNDENLYGDKNYLKNTIVDLNNNPLTCDCRIHSLLRFLEKNVHSSIQNSLFLKIENLRCQEPIWLEKVAVTTLRSDSLTCLVTEPQVWNATCPDQCTCWVRPENQAYLVDCSKQNLTAAPKSIKAPGDHHIEMNLMGNYLNITPSMNQNGYDKVTVLLLAHNNIENVPFESLTTHLRVLTLENNHLSTLDSSVLKYFENSMNLINLTLHNNMWNCDCQARDFFKFIQTKGSRFPELKKVTCRGIDLPMYEMTLDTICPNTTMGWIITGCIVISLFFIIIAILTAMYYRYEQKIKIWLYAKKWFLRWVTEDEVDKNKIYDAFVSYSHEDDDFVVKELVGKLEGGPKPFKLCLHYRDWPAGEWITNQVARSVENSRRTIVVLSKNFLKSEWGKMEFRLAHCQALRERRARVIVIIYGDIPPSSDLDKELQAYLQMNTYVKWGDPWFWEKLRYALPHRNNINLKKKKETLG